MSAERPAPGIVHLGPGAFFRSFVAVHTHDAMATSGGDWGIVGLSLRSRLSGAVLGPSGGSFAEITRGPDGDATRRIDSVVAMVSAAETPDAAKAWLADARIRVVTLTVTEAGYGLRDGALDPAAPGIAHDLGAQGVPRSAPGLLVAGLAQRRAAGLAPPAMVSCDNLPGNGGALAAAVIGMARARDPDLADWIAAEASFPSTMVDRITPAVTDAEHAAHRAATGRDDPALVVAEPFRQWVIEDRFPLGRPDWAAAGAEMVDDAAPHERMKLRLLNGAHSALAYLGSAAGHETVAGAVRDPVIADYLDALWCELIPTIDGPVGVDLGGYAAATAARFRNPRIRHALGQIAAGGSGKMPQRLIAPLVERVGSECDSPAISLAVAGWMRHCATAPSLDDPEAERLAACAGRETRGEAAVAAFLALDGLFPPEAVRNPRLRGALADAYDALAAGPPRALADATRAARKRTRR